MRLGAIQSNPCSENIQQLRLHFFLESFPFFFFFFWTLSDWDYHIVISLDDSEIGGKWKASVNVLSLLRDLESYSSMVLAFRDLLFNVTVHMELKNI